MSERPTHDGAPWRAAERLPHYVSPAPFDPLSVEAMTPEQERFYHGLAMADDVVEAAAPPRRGGLRRRSCW